VRECPRQEVIRDGGASHRGSKGNHVGKRKISGWGSRPSSEGGEEPGFSRFGVLPDGGGTIAGSVPENWMHAGQENLGEIGKLKPVERTSKAHASFYSRLRPAQESKKKGVDVARGGRFKRTL